ncbi:MAG: hypothetical protein PHF63_00465 [Herbinix sp.]|nr:hypothetical protein [Herbinix sp.]
MVNIGHLLTSIKMSLGIYQIKLPFDNPDEALMDVLRIKTLPIFSVYYPYNMRRFIKLADLTPIDKSYERSIYRVPEELVAGRRIITINNIEPRNRPMGGNYLDPNMGYQSSELFGEIMMTQLNQDLTSLVTPPFTWEFREPNILILYNITALYGEAEFDFGLVHDENLSTIPMTLYEAFHELALLDIKEFLYNALKYYNELSTAYGTITLKIDDWSDAANQKSDLLSKWTDTFHLSRKALYIR